MTDRGPYPVEDPDATVGDLASRLASDVGILVRDHVQLAKEELKAEVKEAGTGAGLIGGGAVAGWISVMLVSMGVAWAIAEAIAPWAGFVIVGALWAVVGLVMAASGRRKLEQVDPTPRQTMEEVQEDRNWLNEQTN